MKTTNWEELDDKKLRYNGKIMTSREYIPHLVLLGYEPSTGLRTSQNENGTDLEMLTTHLMTRDNEQLRINYNEYLYALDFKLNLPF